MSTANESATANPTVLHFSADNDIADIYRAHLPPGWSLDALSAAPDEAEKLRKVRRADALFLTETPLTRDHLAVAERLRLIQRQGVGYDTVDLDAVRARGIPLAICPHGTPTAVAEHAILLMLAAGRHIVRLHEDITVHGRWPKWDYRSRTLGLDGATIGIVGFGRIGQEVARRLLAFGSDVLVYRAPGRPPLERSWPRDRVRTCPTLNDLFAAVDIVTLHCPLTPENRGFVNRTLLERMKPEAILVNTARGALVNEDDLVAALRERCLAGAGLDTLTVEPPPADHPLFSLPNVVLTPHMAAGTRQAHIIKAQAMFENVRRVWNGEEPLHRVV
ncbi:MAG: hypothetical protein GEU93_06815 [Propionibacteriales bacterium]|nr:hypothetical protein [Propionibacteriales bacterium]